MKKIIVPVDFSNYSEYALKTAAILAKKHNLEILALHMLDGGKAKMTESSGQSQETTVFHLKLAEKNFNKFLKKEYLKGIKVTPLIKHFKVFSDVNTIAQESNADLIVMGSQGTSGFFKETFVGSNTEKVVRSSNIPVLVVKNENVDLAFNDVVLALDFSEELIDGYKRAMKVLSLLVKNIHLVHINTPTSFKSTNEIKNKIINFLEKAEGNTKKLEKIHFAADYSIEKGIFNFSDTFGADLIALITHGRKGLAHTLKGSISEDIANHSTLPVITFRM